MKHLPDGELGWEFDKERGILYRTFSSAVNFGSQMAAIELYAPVDKGALGAMAYPNTSLDLHWKGIPVASAKFEEIAEPAFFSGVLVRHIAVQWGEGGMLHVKQGLIVPMSIGWRLAFVILCYLYVCIALWWVLGLWLRQQFVRFSSIAEIADGHRTERGLSAGDLEKLHAQGIGVHDELGQLADSFVAMMRRIEDARLAQLEKSARRIVPVLCAGTPALAENGAICGVVGTSTDIGEVKLARDRVDTLLESTGAILYACQADGDYGATFVSANVLDVMGCEAREFTDDPGFWLSRVHPEDAPRVIADMSRLRETGTLKREYRFLHADGTYRWMFDDLRLVRASNGAPVEVVGFWLDVTQRRTDEEQQRESHKLDAIGRLTGGVAHEFNNLLGVIVGNLDLMGEKSPGDRHQAAALEAALKGAEITRSLLAVAQHLPMSLETYDLDALLEEMRKRPVKALLLE